LAARLGLRTCWAVPVRAGDDTVLGMIAVFSRRQCPTDAERQTMETAAQLAAIAIEHWQSSRRMAHLVRHDPLTGLPNRLLFDDRIQQALALARRGGAVVGVLLLDVDHFKSVNDT